ncbi:MAG TPA: threonine--tRNA ligase, partial [Spirochaetota bacterium]|nr:threonine--tRNA ligase [Spirochaetota bacterium]
MEVNVRVGEKNYKIEKGRSLFDLIMKNMPNARFGIVAAKNGEDIIELGISVENDIDIEWISSSSADGLRILRHSASHIMAAAVKTLFPDTKISIGPATDDGFYYDFDSEHRFNEEDFTKIESEMQKIIDSDVLFVKSEININDAIKKFKNENEIYKVELLEELKDQVITLYKNGEFIDLCRGPHAPSTGYIKAFKLLKIAGAYWRGSEKNKMLQRIYGTAYADSKSLKQYLNLLEEAKERDHRKIGKEMN